MRAPLGSLTSLGSQCPHLIRDAGASPAQQGGDAAATRDEVVRCMLADRLVEALLTVEPDAQLLDRLLPDDAEGPVPAICGPDERLIVAGWCTEPRCEGSCEPLYERWIAHYGLEGILPGEGAASDAAHDRPERTPANPLRGLAARLGFGRKGAA